MFSASTKGIAEGVLWNKTRAVENRGGGGMYRSWSNACWRNIQTSYFYIYAALPLISQRVVNHAWLNWAWWRECSGKYFFPSLLKLLSSQGLYFEFVGAKPFLIEAQLNCFCWLV
jgi:hypothetical protein